MKKTGRFIIALSGGNTPASLFNLLAHLPYSTLLQWKNIYIFWSDERCVPADDPENNSNMARKMLIDHVPLPAENVFPVQVKMEPEKAAKQYAQMMKEFFKEAIPSFDLILLGMGEDGHTASLFPGTEKLWQNSSELVIAVDPGNNKSIRISFTPLLINNARNILFLITGENKSDVLTAVFKSKGKTTYPVQSIKAIKGNIIWFADKEAASGLKI